MTKRPIKKRGRKPGVKVGPYKKREINTTKAITLFAQLDDATADLEARICSHIRRIKGLM